MVTLEKITKLPNFSSQLDNKILYSEHDCDIEIQYQSTCTIKYVIEGSKHYHFKNQDSRVSSGQYIILNNRDIATKALKGSKGLSIFLSPKLISEILHNLYGKNIDTLNFFEFPQSQHNLLGYQLKKMAHIFNNDPIFFLLQIEDLFMNLSETLIRYHVNLETKFSELKIAKYNTQKELFKYVSLTKEFIHDNYNHKISLDTLSKSSGISKYYLHRLFTEIIGHTPIEYLTYLRLNSAKRELKNTKKSIFEIAIDNGFESSSYFSSIFKKSFKISPSQYRKQ